MSGEYGYGFGLGDVARLQELIDQVADEVNR